MIFFHFPRPGVCNRSVCRIFVLIIPHPPTSVQSSYKWEYGSSLCTSSFPVLVNLHQLDVKHEFFSRLPTFRMLAPHWKLLWCHQWNTMFDMKVDQITDSGTCQDANKPQKNHIKLTVVQELHIRADYIKRADGHLGTDSDVHQLFFPSCIFSLYRCFSWYHNHLSGLLLFWSTEMRLDIVLGNNSVRKSEASCCLESTFISAAHYRTSLDQDQVWCKDSG